MKQTIEYCFHFCNLLLLFSGIDLLCQHSGAKPRGGEGGLTLGVILSVELPNLLRCFVLFSLVETMMSQREH